MAARYAPLNLPAQVHDLPHNYGQCLIQFDGTGYYTALEHLDKLNDFIDLGEVDHDDVKLKLFAQSLSGEVEK